MNYVEYTIKPSLDKETLVANIGGLIGLFVGARVLTIYNYNQVFELIFHLLLNVMAHCRVKTIW